MHDWDDDEEDAWEETGEDAWQETEQDAWEDTEGDAWQETEGDGEGLGDDGREGHTPGADERPDWETVDGTAIRTAPRRPRRQPVGRRCPACSVVVPAGMPVCPACLSPAGAGPRPQRPAGGALRLVFRAGGRHLDVPCGTQLRLGRSGTWAPEASALLAGEETVSARHATVEHRQDGSAWVREVAQGATNGTRVNGRVLGPDGSARLRDGDRVELGPRVSFVVLGVEEGPAVPPY
ncbi:FHA domain-containing protein [Streptomyces sp. FXJ1.172]|uniref:FHA domain-containing protein n=1 Tax=Streptomyces sp. FXJ1.172 TaxID=710705 RepID=UPI001F451295|nr:FHA domain-containing protein [Streptomyces sp. FXJ1.172]WEP00167.1 FHA domain-containing protein [Streptomyces sp. FXJ1.172]